MPTFSILKPPTTGTAITKKDGRLVVPDDPIIPFIEGDGTGPDIWRASVRVLRRGGRRRRTAARRRSPGSRCSPARRASRQFSNWLPDDTLEAVPSLLGRHQGTADDAGRRRHPIAERHAAPGARPLCLPPAGPWYHGRAVAGEASREDGHGDLPREHRRHLRRHRVGRGHAGGAEGPRLPRQGVPEGVQEDSLWHAQAAQDGRRSSKASALQPQVGVQVGVGLKPISYLGTSG